MYEYYTFPGSSEILIQIFNAVAMICGGNDYAGLMQVSALLGFIVCIVVAVYKLDIKDSFVYLFVVSTIWMVMMVPKVTVVVVETSGHNMSAVAHRVDNIPFGLAVSGHFISKFGVWMTKSAENVYSLPNDMQYSETGVLFGNRLLRQLHGTNFTNQILQDDWTRFMDQCSFYDMNFYHKYALNDLLDSENILETLGNTNQSLYTTVTDLNTKESEAMTCKNAYTRLYVTTNTNLVNEVIPDGAQRALGMLGWSQDNVGPNFSTVYSSMGDSALQYMFKNASVDSLEATKQAAMINMVKNAEIRNASAMNNQQRLSVALATAQAERQWIMSQQTGGAQASGFLPVMRATLEGIVIGLFPFIMFIALIAGVAAFKSIMFYFATLFWVQLWAPLAAIMNLVMTSHSQNNIYSNLYAQGNMTLRNSFGILHAAVEGEAMAGYALWLVPTLSFALVYGSRSLGNAMIGMISSGQNVGNAAGSEVAKGNVNLGNISYNNANANKNSSDAIYTDPSMVRVNTATGNYTQSASNVGTMSVNKNDLPVSGNTSAIMSSTYTQAAQTLNNWAKGQEQQAMQSLSSASTNAFALTTSYGNTQAANDTLAANSSASVQAYMAKNQAAAREITAGTEYSNDVSFQTRIAAGLNAGINFSEAGLSAGGQISGDAFRTSKSTIGEKYNQQLTANSKEDTGQRQEYLESVAKNSGFSNTDSAGQTYQQNLSNSLAQTATSSQMAKEARTLSKSYADTASKLASTGGAITVDQNNLIANIARENGMTLDQIKQDPESLAQAVQSGITSKIDQMNQATAGTAWDSNPNGTSIGVGHVPNMGGSVKAAGDAAVYDNFNTTQADLNEASEPVRTSNQGIARQQQSLQQDYDANHSGSVSNVDAQATSINQQGKHVRDLGSEAKERGTGTVAQNTISKIAGTGKDEEANSQTRLGVVSNHGGLGSGQTTFKFNSQLRTSNTNEDQNSQGKGEASQE